MTLNMEASPPRMPFGYCWGPEGPPKLFTGPEPESAAPHAPRGPLRGAAAAQELRDRSPPAANRINMYQQIALNLEIMQHRAFITDYKELQRAHVSSLRDKLARLEQEEGSGAVGGGQGNAADGTPLQQGGMQPNESGAVKGAAAAMVLPGTNYLFGGGPVGPENHKWTPTELRWREAKRQQAEQLQERVLALSKRHDAVTALIFPNGAPVLP